MTAPTGSRGSDGLERGWALTGAARAPWRNWGGNERARPLVVRPGSEEEVAALLLAARERGLAVRPVGSGHSFTALAVTDGVHVRLDALTGVVGVRLPDDSGTGEVTVRAGTTIGALTNDLLGRGLALPNLGDIDHQTVAGALGTGTHGTGLGLTGLAAGVRAMRLALPDGRLVDVSPEADPGLFEAARISLGALGIVIRVTLAVVPAFLLRARETPEPLEPVLAGFADEAAAHDHMELYWFPHTDRALVKRNDRVPTGTPRRPVPGWRARLDDDLLSNRLFEVTNRLATARPALTPRINAVAARALSAREYVDHSHRVFVSERDVHFVESEWAFPRAALPDVVAELRRWVDTSGERLPFPVEVRVAAADDVWLSTAYGRESAYVAVHQYHRLDHRRYFAAFEEIALAHEGRPHWGKLHTRDAAFFAQAYPRFGDWLAVRDRVDPDRVLVNPHLQQVLGD